MELSEAKKLFSLDSLDRRLLLKKYRALAFTCHPDYGGDPEAFNRLMDAFHILSKNCKDGVDDKGAKTIDGKRISDLGKGYPITESARTCDACDGKGYNMFHGNAEGTGEYKTCPACGGDRVKSYPCNRCEGTGKYKHPKSGKIIGECRGCKGTGKFYLYARKRRSNRFGFMFEDLWRFDMNPYIPGTDKRGIPCDMCCGDGKVEIKTNGEPFYTVCRKCEGVGEEKMWNPVLPRGLFTNGLQKDS